MILSHFPSLLRGMTQAEKKAFSALPWEQGEKIPDKSAKVFFCVAGYLRSENHNFRHYELAGTLPFIENHPVKYEANGKFLILDTAALAEFLLQRPALLRSYLSLAEAANFQILADWNQNCGIRMVGADYSSADSALFSLALAQRFRKKNQKVLLAEVGTEGQSIFDFFSEFSGENLPAALSVISDSETSSDTGHLVNNRVRKTQAGIDLLNVHFLSPFSLAQAEWQLLLPYICSQYDEIIFHTGDKTRYLPNEQADSFFYLHKNYFISPKNLPHDQIGCLHAIFTGNAKNNTAAFPPDRSAGSIEAFIDSEFGAWLDNNHTISCYTDACGHYDAFAQHVAVAKDNAAVYTGFSSLYIHLNEISENAQKITKEIFEKALPHFPGKGFFRESSISDYLLSLFREKDMNERNHVLLQDPANNDFVITNLAPCSEKITAALFTAGIFEGNWQKQSLYKLYRGPAQNYFHLLAFLARKKIDQIELVTFAPALAANTALETVARVYSNDSFFPAGGKFKETVLPEPMT